MSRSPLTRRGFVAAAAALCAPACTALFGRSSARELRVLIGGTPGSSYERIARLLARPLEASLDRRLLLMLVPPASGRLMASQLARAPSDGSVIGFAPSGLIYAELLAGPGIAFELRRFRWLASATAERRVLLLSNRLGIRTIDDLLAYDRAINVSANAAGSPTHVSPLLLNAMLGTRLRAIPGYRNAGREASVLGGEVDGVVTTVSSGGGLLGSGEVTPILRLSHGPAPDAIAHVPTLRDVAMADRWRPLVDLIEAHDDFGRAVAAPPMTDIDEVRALRAGFDAVLADPGVVAAAARGGIQMAAVRGEDVERRVERLFDEEAPVAPLLAEALACGAQRSRDGRAC